MMCTDRLAAQSDSSPDAGRPQDRCGLPEDVQGSDRPDVLFTDLLVGPAAERRKYSFWIDDDQADGLKVVKKRDGVLEERADPARNL
jgi:hypothetical protein